MGQSESTLSKSSKSSNGRANPFRDRIWDQLYADRNETGDVTFGVQSEAIKAHRSVLAALSPKYKIQFYGSMSERSVIEVKDISRTAFNEFLQFFYKREVTLTMNNIDGVLDLAKQSLVDDLITECTDFLLNMVGLDKITWCYRLSILYEIKRLQEFCEDQISVDIKTVFETDDFLSCDRDTLCRILKLDTLNCKETEVFDACIKWASAASRKKGVDGSNGSNLRNALRDAISDIRFCTMTVEEFAERHEKYKGFFSTQESNEIFYGIGKVKGVKSHFFNSKPRKPKTTISTNKSNELNLVCEIAELSKTVQYVRGSNEIDKIAFICDGTVFLSGLDLCVPVSSDLTVDINVGNKLMTEYSMKFLSSHDTKIELDGPIEINAHERCLITLKSKSFKSDHSVYRSKREVKFHDVWIQFLNSEFGNNSPNTVKTLKFSRLVKH